MHRKSFASDNYAGMHPDILKAITDANVHHVPAYGGDDETARAINKFKELFGEEASVYFVLNGTAANVLSLQAMTRSYHSVICAETAHIQMDECGAPEKMTGCKLMLVSTTDGKLTVSTIKRHLARVGDQHAVQPRVISISQSTEYGTVYTPEEVRVLADYAHQHDMYLHMDGARICNAVASLNTTFSALTCDVGVDVLSFGGTKIGMMMGEAVVILNQEFAKDFQFIRKQGMQLASKMRFISAQFHALLSNDLWRRNALHANQMATLLAEKLKALASNEIKVTQLVQANAVFVLIPEKYIVKLQENFHFYVWDEKLSEARLMTSFDTSEEDINDFIHEVERLVSV